MKPRGMWAIRTGCCGSARRPQYTLYHVDPSHGGPVAEKLLGPDYAGVAGDRLPRRVSAAEVSAAQVHRASPAGAAQSTRQESHRGLAVSRRLGAVVAGGHRAASTSATHLPADTFAQRRAALEATWDKLLARRVTQAGRSLLFGPHAEHGQPSLRLPVPRCGDHQQPSRARDPPRRDRAKFPAGIEPSAGPAPGKSSSASPPPRSNAAANSSKNSQPPSP